jgi:hypothetical protein
LRAPRRGFFSLDCRSLPDFRFGLLMMNVPLPRYSAEYCFSSAMKFYCLMKRLLAFLLLATLAPLARPQSLFSEIPSIQDGLSSITGLPFTHQVPYALMTKDQLRRDFEQRIKASMKPADLRAQELTLKLLGLVPAEFDLRQNTIDLLTEQAAAFYDYNKKKLFVLEETGKGGTEERIALVHELAHALADQHFHLAKYVHEGLRSDDGATARMAVMEGQASWLMAAYLSKQAGGGPDVPPAMLELMTQSIQTSAEEYPVFSKAPLYIRESLTFPYAKGMLFQNEVYRKLGRESFSEIFLHPPASTQQILHPELYLAHKAPSIPDLPAIPSSKEFRKLGDGTLGELEYRVLLTEYLDAETGNRSAAHLAGSSYGLLEDKRDKSVVLAFASTWDSEDSAREYFDQYRRVLRGKSKMLEVSSDTASSLEGHTDNGYFQVWLTGTTVSHLEGWKSPLH